jgi:uncharacterized protein YjbJ (UPF0337 family)
MDQNTFQGAAKETVGKAREAVGNVTGDAKSQVQGKIEETAGSLQQSYGSMMDDLDALATRLRERTREQPITAILAAAALGYLIGRVGRYI